jgi:hypothetical protein
MVTSSTAPEIMSSRRSRLERRSDRELGDCRGRARIPRGLLIPIKHAFTVKLLAPFAEMHDDGLRRQLEICGRCCPAAGSAFVEGRKC